MWNPLPVLSLPSVKKVWLWPAVLVSSEMRVFCLSRSINGSMSPLLIRSTESFTKGC